MKKMDTTTAEIEQVKADLAVAKGEEAAQYQSMKLRIKHIYESGNTSYLEMLFSSASMSEFLNKAEFISAVSELRPQSSERTGRRTECRCRKRKTASN